MSAARIAAEAGAAVLITATPLVAEALEGAEVGTWFDAAPVRHTADAANPRSPRLVAMEHPDLDTTVIDARLAAAKEALVPPRPGDDGREGCRARAGRREPPRAHRRDHRRERARPRGRARDGPGRPGSSTGSPSTSARIAALADAVLEVDRPHRPDRRDGAAVARCRTACASTRCGCRSASSARSTRRAPTSRSTSPCSRSRAATPWCCAAARAAEQTNAGARRRAPRRARRRRPAGRRRADRRRLRPRGRDAT